MTRNRERSSTTLYMRLDNPLALACRGVVELLSRRMLVVIESQSGWMSDGGLHLVPRGVHTRLRSRSLRIGEAELCWLAMSGNFFSKLGSDMDASGRFLTAALCCVRCALLCSGNRLAYAARLLRRFPSHFSQSD